MAELGGVSGWETGLEGDDKASRIKRRESTCVGGLLSCREREMHQEPAGGPEYIEFVSEATKKLRHHKRPLKNGIRDESIPNKTSYIPRAMNSSGISFEMAIRLWN